METHLSDIKFEYYTNHTSNSDVNFVIKYIFFNFLGNNVLRQLIYESNTEASGSHLVANLETVPAMWRFRTRVSIEHLMQALSQNMAAQTQGDQQSLQQHRVLQLFLEKVN